MAGKHTSVDLESSSTLKTECESLLIEEASLVQAVLGREALVVVDCRVVDRKLPMATGARVKGMSTGSERSKREESNPSVYY